MTASAVVNTALKESSAAGRDLGQQISDAFHGERPHAVIVFASAGYEFKPLLESLAKACNPGVLAGCSSAGEFTGESHGVGTACAFALRAPEMQFNLALGRNLKTNRAGAAASVANGLKGIGNSRFAFRAALVLTDALAGEAEALVEELAARTGGTYRLFGGGAGGDDQFEGRFVFAGTEPIADAVVVVEILSNKPIGIGARHGWSPATPPLRVTEASGQRLGSLNAIAAADVFAEHAQKTGQTLDTASPLPFFLHNVLGVRTVGGYKLRVPLAINADRSVQCATEVPAAATACVMSVTTEAAATAAAESVAEALSQLEGHKPAAALFFDCVATRLRMGKTFGVELDAVRAALGGAKFAGCNSIGQIASGEGRFSGFHNCTAVVCVFPE